MAKSSSASSSLSSASKAASSAASSSLSSASKAAASAASSASSSLSSASKAASSAASKSLSSASKAGSSALLASSSSASSALLSASAKASAAVTGSSSTGSSSAFTALTSIAVIFTVLAVAIAGIYFSGYADDIFVKLAERFYKAKAKAEITALENVGEGQAEGFLKDQLKKNPMMGEHELNQVSSGLGTEAAQQGLAGVSSKLGSLGKL